MPVTSVRLDKDDLDWLDEIADRENLDRSTLIKKAIHKGVREILLEESLRLYQGGKCSAWAAAEDAHITLWEFLEELRRRDLHFYTDEDELEKSLEEFA